jgi:hypothetical protein
MRYLDCLVDAKTYDQHIAYTRAGTEEKAGLTSRILAMHPKRTPDLHTQDRDGGLGS